MCVLIKEKRIDPVNKKERYLKNKTWCNANKERRKLQLQKYYLKNKLKIKTKQKEYNKKYPHIRREYLRKYFSSRLKYDNNFKLGIYMRNRIRLALKRNTKHGHTINLLGCTIIDLKTHLENQFKPGMSWNNYGRRWHVDHIKPCSLFNLDIDEEQCKCFHYTNLQPLWAEENIRKNNDY